MISTRYIIILILCLFIPSLMFSQQNENQSKWLEIYQLEKEGLTKSALEKVNDILTAAESKSDDSEVLKASLYQSKYWLLLEENARLKVLQGFRQRTEEADFPYRNFYELITAQSLNNYFNRNRYRIGTRDNEKVDTTDFNFWNESRFRAEIHKLYQSALNEFQKSDTLKLKEYPTFFLQEGVNETNIDYLSGYILEQALSFYLGRITINDFKNLEWLPSLARYWDTDAFLGFNINVLDSVFSGNHGFKLLQQTLAQHKASGDKKRYLHWELYRLNQLRDEDPTRTSYIKALDNLAEIFPDKYKVTVLYTKAEVLNQLGNKYSYLNSIETNRWSKKEAYTLCKEIIRLAPASFEAKQAKALMLSIEQGNLSVRQENFTIPNEYSRVLVEFQNHTEIEFAIYKGAWDQIQNIAQRFAKDIPEALTKLTEIKSWKIDLPPTNDFQTHASEVLIDPLAHGQYILVAYDSSQKRILAKGAFQVSNHAFLELPSNNGKEYLISDRLTGKPASGATIRIQSGQFGNQKPIDTHLTADSNGRIRYLTNYNYYDVLATAVIKRDTTYYGKFYMYKGGIYDEDQGHFTVRTDLFTDRAIYRPGQMFYYKGILSKQGKNQKSIVAGEEVIVTVYDNNHDSIYEETLKTNDYGSFSDSLKIPKSVMPGEFRIQVEEGLSDSEFYDNLIDDFIETDMRFRVENYKRPKFEVQAEPIKEAYVLGDSVTFRGKAVALAGSNISGASVKFNIKRTGYLKTQATNLYGNGRVSNDLMQLEGTTTTDEEGNFIITFLAAGDARNVIDELPVFDYEIIVSITDLNGETRSLRETVSVGYHKARASVASPNKLIKGDILELSVSQSNLNNQPLDVNGTLYVYKSTPHKTYIKERVWSAPDMPIIAPKRFAELFPFEPFDQASEGLNESLIYKKELSSEADIILIPESSNWEEGNYVIRFETNEKHAYKSVSHFNLIDKSKRRTDTEFIDLSINKTSYQPREKLKLSMYTSLDALSLTLMIDKVDQGRKEYIFNLDKGQRDIKLPISKNDFGGFTIYYLAQGAGHVKTGQLNVNVPYPKAEIELETTSFRNKLEPGQEETWSFKVKGEKKGNVEAELLASMYDASLDQFVDHQWTYQPFRNTNNHGNDEVSLMNSYSTYNLQANGYYYNFTLPNKSRYAFNKYGYDFSNPRQGQNRYFDKFLIPNINNIVSKLSLDISKGEIQGVIKDNFGIPIPFAAIELLNSSEKFNANASGQFKIKAQPRDRLLIKQQRYTHLELIIGFDNYYNIRLIPEGRSLGEVEVLGTRASTPAKKLAFTVSTISEETYIEEADLLMGKIAGIRVVPAGPGVGAQIQIRGASSLAGSKQPLIVLDGVLVDKSMSDLNLQEIVSYEVLKGNSAATLYGSRAANGVIILTSKSGRQKQDALFSQVKRRTNFNETAFFFPHLRTNKKGEVSFSFTTPESLTKWKFQLLAHTKSLLSDRLVNTVQTQKQLMVIPNFPRFVRESDTLVIAVKVASLNESELNGIARIEWLNPENDEPLNLLVKGESKDKNFKLSAKGNESLEWRIYIPEGTQGIKYRVLASANGFTDGEENYLPVLPNSIMVRESLPIWVNANEEKSYDFEAVSQASASKKNYSLTFEVANNPLWNVVQSLPYLMEFPYECSEQTFSRIFANAVGQQIVLSNPKLASLISNWATSDVPGPLFNNDELRSIALKETPWLLDAKDEKSRLQTLAKLLDEATVKEQLHAAISKLSAMQLSNGGFPWFSGSNYANRTITTHIAAGFGQLKNLGISLTDDKIDELTESAFEYLDDQFIKGYKLALRDSLSTKKKQISARQIHYLYARSFYDSLYQDEDLNQALSYFNDLGETTWLTQNLQAKAMLALSYHRIGNGAIARQIMKSVEENSTTTDRGMYWLENESSFNWYQMPIETHSLLIEAFDEIIPDADRKQNLTKWLLENKRAKSWSNTKSTTSAIYTLLNNESIDVDKNNVLKAQVGNDEITNSESLSQGLYTKKVWKTEEIKADMSQINLINEGTNPSWGAMHYQYFEKLENIKQAGGSLQVIKEIFKAEKSGDQEQSLDGKEVFKIGDRVKVRLLLSTDRDMEFIHLKDLRAAGFEPLDVLSGHQNFGGAYAYRAIDDTSIHFFFDRLNKGKYLIEYDLIVNNAGSFSTGIATVESMYATEFNARTNSIPVRLVKK